MLSVLGLLALRRSNTVVRLAAPTTAAVLILLFSTTCNTHTLNPGCTTQLEKSISLHKQWACDLIASYNDTGNPPVYKGLALLFTNASKLNSGQSTNIYEL
jgi:hypothetical protein